MYKSKSKKMMPKKDMKRKPMMYGSRTPMKKGKEVNNKIMYSMGGEVQKPN
tara:strand:+ start:215 stop:367 length:153 start_codon:yes stop_codon:yes gene_type:complete